MAPLVCAATLAVAPCARADQGGTAFWLSGQYASFAAVPATPGWSLPTQLYYYSGAASGGATVRGAAATAGTRSRTPILFVTPTFTPAATVLGGRLSLGLGFGFGYDRTSVDASAPALGAGISNADGVWGFADLGPSANLAWSSGVHNGMVYATGNVPIGSYDSQRLANIGIGFGAIDAGGGYTYFDQATGWEFSAVAGVTWNLENPSTNIRNGIDSHLDWSASRFLSGNWQVGLAGYVYYQLTGDSGSGDTAGAFKSRVAAIGPQLGCSFDVGGQQWSANLRGYGEFWAENRLQGYALFATLAVPLGGKRQ